MRDNYEKCRKKECNRFFPLTNVSGKFTIKPLVFIKEELL